MTEIADRIYLITGGTSGIGAAAAQQLASFGGTVVIVGRNARKCVRRIDAIRRTAPNARLDYVVADLSSQQQIRRLAGEFAARYARLDVLINNAGAYFGKREVSVDGLEMNLALNHLSYFLLTSLLLDQLNKSASARIVVVSSEAHRNSTVNFDDLQSEHDYDRLRAYGQSKLANLLFTYALARRLQGTRITVNALHPGAVATNIGSNVNWLKTRLRNLLVRSMLSPEEGAKTITFLATSPSVEGITGKYFYQCREIRSSEISYVEANAEQLWHRSEALVGFRPENKDPAIRQEPKGTGLRIRLAKPRDARQIAELHHLCGVNNAQSLFQSLGVSFLTRYYKLLLNEKNSIVLCAEDNSGNILGFISGSQDTAEHMANLKRHFLYLLAGTTTSLVFHPKLLQDLLLRWRALSVAGIENGYIVQSGNRIEYWCWHPQRRHPSASIVLLQAFISLMRRLGAKQLRLEVDEDNRKVVITHRLQGAKISNNFTLPDGRRRLIMEYQLEEIPVTLTYADKTPTHADKKIYKFLFSVRRRFFGVCQRYRIKSARSEG